MSDKILQCDLHGQLITPQTCEKIWKDNSIICHKCRADRMREKMLPVSDGIVDGGEIPLEPATVHVKIERDGDEDVDQVLLVDFSAAKPVWDELRLRACVSGASMVEQAIYELACAFGMGPTCG